jgi:hypothetical protein
MPDTVIKKPVFIVGTQAQVSATTVGENDLVAVTDDPYYTAKETDQKIAEVSGDIDAVLGVITDDTPVVKYGVTIDNLFGDIDENGVVVRPTQPFELNMVGVKEIPAQSYYGRFYYNTAITAAYFPDLEYINGGTACYYMFLGCSKLNILYTPKLKSIIGTSACLSGFSGIGVTEIDLPELEIIDGNGACQYMFSSNRNMVRCYLPKLKTINGTGVCKWMFQYCYALERLDFPSLTTISSVDSFEYMLRDNRALTEVHFRADMQATIEAMNQYSSKFGAGADCTFYFDL